MAFGQVDLNFGWRRRGGDLQPWRGKTMANVYVEARPKGSPEGSRIADYAGQSSEPSRHRKRRSMGRKGRDIHRWLRASAI